MLVHCTYIILSIQINMLTCFLPVRAVVTFIPWHSDDTPSTLTWRALVYLKQTCKLTQAYYYYNARWITLKSQLRIKFDKQCWLLLSQYFTDNVICKYFMVLSSNFDSENHWLSHSFSAADLDPIVIKSSVLSLASTVFVSRQWLMSCYDHVFSFKAGGWWVRSLSTSLSQWCNS